MKLFTAIYSTEKIKNIEYAFYAENIESANAYADTKFSAKEVKIVEEDFIPGLSIDVAPTLPEAISIVLGTDDEGNFVSISVWAADSIEIYKSFDLESEESKKWLSKIELEEGKKYYNL